MSTPARRGSTPPRPSRSFRAIHIVIDARILRSSTGVVVERLLHHLQDLDARNRYTVLLDGRAEPWQPRAANFATLPVDVPHHSLAEQTRLRRTIDRLRPDLVHFCAPQQPVLTRWPKVTTIHDLTILRQPNPHMHPLAAALKRRIGWWAFRRAAHESARVIAVSRYTADDVIRSLGADRSRVRVIYNAADVGPGSTPVEDMPFTRWILHVGRQPPYKNVAALCDAHQRLLDRWPDLGLVLVGRMDDDVRRTQAHCEARGFRNIWFTGFLDDARRNWLYRNAAAYVFPSVAEGFGLPGLEAMLHGAPVVSSDRTCLPEIYGDAAAYFDPTDIADMADAIARVVGDESLRATLVARGHARAARFSWARMAAETLALYEEVGAEGCARR